MKETLVKEISDKASQSCDKTVVAIKNIFQKVTLPLMLEGDEVDLKRIQFKTIWKIEIKTLVDNALYNGADGTFGPREEQFNEGYKNIKLYFSSILGLYLSSFLVYFDEN